MSSSSFKDYRYRWVAFFIAIAVLFSGTVYAQEEKTSKTVMVMGKSVIDWAKDNQKMATTRYLLAVTGDSDTDLNEDDVAIVVI